MIAPPEIVLRDVTLGHGRAEVVRGLSGRFAPGSLTAVVGENGAGKTTLLRALAGLHPVASGRIGRGGLAASGIAWLAQSTTLDRSFPITCADVVALGLLGRLGAWRGLAPAQRQAAADALAAVGMTASAGRLVGQLSAGQFQRVLFARVLVQDAPVVLLDEPFNAVDAASQAVLLDAIRRLHREGRTVIAVLHDLEMVRRECPDTLHLGAGGGGGAIAWGPTSSVLAGAPVRSAA